MRSPTLLVASCLLLILDVLAVPHCKISSSPTAASDIPSSTSTSGSGSGTPIDPSLRVAAAWYPDWLADLTPADVSWDKYTMVTWAFGLTTPDTSTISITNGEELKDLVQAAHEHDVKALVSIGGWSGSIYFSNAVATAENRTTFVQTISNLITEYDLDGIDFDWEYPNKQGIGCNVIAPDDSANFLSFLQELRESIGDDKYLSAAVSIVPFSDANGVPMTDVSGFADVLNHIAIMAYDISGSWSATVGPNAPLNDSCATAKTGSAVSAVEAWRTAGMPVNQIALGVAAYGHSFTVPTIDTSSSSKLDTFPAFTGTPMGDRLDGAFTDQCGTTTQNSGIFNFWGLVEDGFLTQYGTAQAGIEYFFDECSQTPFVYNSDTKVMVSYDDATSFQAKASFIEETGLRGFAMWHIAGDSNDILLDAITA